MLNNFSIGKKLGIGFAIILTIMAIIATLASKDTMHAQTKIRHLAEVSLAHTIYLSNIADKVNEVTIYYYQVLSSSHEKALIAEKQEKIATAHKEVGVTVRNYQETIDESQLTGTEKQLYATFLTNRPAFLASLTTANSLIETAKETGDWHEYEAFLGGTFEESATAYISAVDHLLMFTEESITHESEQVIGQLATGVKMGVTIFAIGTLLGILLAVFITRAITRPVTKCLEVANSISQGNIDVELQISSKDEVGMLSSAMNTMISSIKGLYEDVYYVSHEAMEGRLQSRSDVSKHSGKFAEIMTGFNGTLDAVTIPMNEAMDVMKKVANKDLTARITGNYKGDLHTFASDINTAVANLDESLNQVDMAVDQITSASNEISTGSLSLADATSEQA
ncbi:MAG: HAMP domain-containing protein, partial [Candidatus Cloacimonetes bacterium]|nr:HAMP domain-containing protein [Candidatus Cloacimonadota bacterium]